MLKTLYIETWGCQMNEYDSQKMALLLKKSHQLTLVKDPTHADVLLLNTCSIREKAQEKVFSLLGRWKDIKTQSPHVLVGVGGCVASQEGENIFKRAPQVDFVFGPQTLQLLPAFVNQALAGIRHQVDVKFTPEDKFDNLPAPEAQGPAGYVTIQEGCSKFCKYCIVPFTRGQEVNRPFEDIIHEVHQLAEQGVREVTLLGQNVNAYRGKTPTKDDADLAMLIFYVSHVPGIERIRFMTSHPVEFSETLIDAYEHVPQLVSHLHLPVQSGSNRVLQAMGRGHNIEEYIEKIQKIKAIRPDLTVTSDFIVAYPGETEEDFQETLDLVQQVGFDQSFSFIFSPRPGTVAAGLTCSLTYAEKLNRLERLQALLQQQAENYQQAMVGKTVRVLVTNLSRDKITYFGRCEHNRSIHLMNGTADLVGKFVDVVIIEALAHSLRGRVIGLNDPYLNYESSAREVDACL